VPAEASPAAAPADLHGRLRAWRPRAGRPLRDGWLPAGIPLSGVEAMMGQVRQLAAQAGRDPASLKRWCGHVYLTGWPLGADRADFTGSLDQIKSDVERPARSAPTS